MVSVYTMMRDMAYSLARSMTQRANGTLHARGCFNAQVCSQWYGCSPTCIEDNERLRVARAWLEEHRPVVPKMTVPGR